MLIGIDPLHVPDLSSILRSIGHGDEIAVADANLSRLQLSQAAGAA